MPTTMRSDRKPPLGLRSPIRLRPRHPLQSSLPTLQTPSGTVTKSRLPKQPSVMEELELRPEYHTMSCELNALTKMVQDTLWGSATTNQSGNERPLFQRGKFYEKYSAIRSERLKRKRGESVVEKKTPCKQYLGVRVESAMKKPMEVKKFESARKMATPLMERRQTATTQRYSLRSSCKENKKPPLAMSSLGVATVERKTARKRY
ncbi:hypothetical protein M8C21_023978 [Ambrosia artemisiifolia]|uniref:Uncharacterized protein n=1 Tax=Ambrosia artemisiifolia TaxID=4212 RepID=A0AAD5G138_AMBAR|nr:hypothetical protein M8C21_023978 [Ambrosia artemisiifolia]